MAKLTLEKLIEQNKITGKRVLVRVDFNVPLDENRNITDDNRIVASLPTINTITGNGGKCILMSHLGRPKGEKNMKYSLDVVADRLSELTGKKVIFAKDCIGEENMNMIEQMNNGDIMLLENLRFYKEEEKNVPEFAKKLASYGDVYVNDAFGTAHRAHASTEGVTHYISDCAAGFLMQKELKYLMSAIENPDRPLVAILGGSKISGKIDVLENLLNIADTILIGGGMMYTFYKAMGLEIGKSLVEEDKIELANEILKKAKDKNKNLKLPVDMVVTDKIDEQSVSSIVAYNKLKDGNLIGVDIGPETVKIYTEEILKGKTIVWNGPMGVFEIDKFAKGTYAIAQAMADATDKGAVTIIGGGDSGAAIVKANLADKVTHVSTGGGASLELLEGKVLPGVAALTDI